MRSVRAPHAATVALLTGLLAGGCSASSDVLVFVQTDLRPGADALAEFDEVRVSLEPGAGSSITVPVSRLTFGARRATRVSLFRGLAAGAYRVRASFHRDGAEVVASSAQVSVRGTDVAVLLPLDRRCRQGEGARDYVSCEGEDRTCLGGECVEMACLLDPTAPGCPSACADDDDCAMPGLCSIARCLSGTCISVPNDALCAIREVCGLGGACEPDTRTCADALFEDRDGDGVGGAAVVRCPGPGLIAFGGDCDDLDPDVRECPDAGLPGPDAAASDAPSQDGGPGDTAEHDAGTDAAVLEDCAPSASGPADEDADGAIDEGCPFFFDTAHGFLDIAPEYSTEPIGDPPLLVVMSGPDGVWASSRPTLLDPFARPELVPTDVDALTAPSRFWMAALLRHDVDGLVAGCSGIAQAQSSGRNWLFELERSGGCGPTDTLVVGAEIASELSPTYASLIHPFVSDDGLSLVFVGIDGGDVRHLLVGSRTRVRDPFGDFQEVATGPPIYGLPSMSEDARTVLFGFVAGGLGSATRSTVSTRFGPATAFGTPSMLGQRPTFASSTREVFASLATRARFSRDHARADSVSDCMMGAVRVRGRNCIALAPASLPWAATTCGGRTHLATGAADLYGYLLSGVALDPATWVGARDVSGVTTWVTGESSPPVLATDECACLGPSAIIDGCDCATALPALCETEVWPTWDPAM